MVWQPQHWSRQVDVVVVCNAQRQPESEAPLSSVRFIPARLSDGILLSDGPSSSSTLLRPGIQEHVAVKASQLPTTCRPVAGHRSPPCQATAEVLWRPDASLCTFSDQQGECRSCSAGRCHSGYSESNSVSAPQSLFTWHAAAHRHVGHRSAESVKHCPRQSRPHSVADNGQTFSGQQPVDAIFVLGGVGPPHVRCPFHVCGCDLLQRWELAALRLLALKCSAYQHSMTCRQHLQPDTWSQVGCCQMEDSLPGSRRACMGP